MSLQRTFAVLAAFAALAALLSACGGGGGSEDPQKVIEDATFAGIESGTVALDVHLKSEGKKGGEVKVAVSGPFQSTGKASLPELAMTATAKGQASGEKVDFEGGLTVLNDRAYIGYQGKDYEVDPTTFGFVKSGFEKAEQEGAKEGGKGETGKGETGACRQAATSLPLGEFVSNLENEGSEEVEGVKTTRLSGDLNPKGAVDAVIKLVETPTCSSELEAAGGVLPLHQLKEYEGELTGAIKKAHVEVFVGEGDHIIRKVVAELTVEPKGSGERTEAQVDLTLGGVNEKQSIKAPTGAEPLEKLFGELGINPLELMGMLQGGGGGEGIGGLLEGLSGAIGGEPSSGGSGGKSGGGEGGSNFESEPPSVEASKEFAECLSEAKSAADVQKCAALVE